VINAEYVEKALLGTLLNDPTRRADVPWVQVSDFTNPLCRALWAHLEHGSPPHFKHPIDYVERHPFHNRLLDPEQGRPYGGSAHAVLRSPVPNL